MARDAGYAHDHLAPLRRDRGHDDRRPRGRHGAPARSRPARRAAPIASANTTSCCASRRSSARGASFAGRRRHPRARGVAGDDHASTSSCCATARAPGTRRTGSPAGPTSICPTAAATRRAKPAACCSDGGYVFDVAYTSVLKRAIRTLWIALDALDLLWIPVHEGLAAERAALRRAAGAEQGGDRRASTARRRSRSGAAATTSRRRRSTPDDPRHPSRDPRYAALDADASCR